ncbi:hypothetical protein C8Q80DRAFT_1282759, partial [Daedaleopsis nitida]
KTCKLVDQAHNSLSSLPWSATLSGFSKREPVATLTSYLSRTWLSDIHENQLLDLLHTKLARQPEGLLTEVENLYFWKALEQRFWSGDREAYQKDQYFSCARGVGEMLQRGERNQLSLLVNISNTYWVAIVVDFSKLRVLYGNSLNHPPDPHIINVLTWWHHNHSTT